MIIYGKERRLDWAFYNGQHWVTDGKLWGGGSLREHALADLADQIEYIEGGDYGRAHESWCEHFVAEQPKPGGAP